MKPHRLRFNIAAMGAAQAANLVVPIVTFPYLARTLGVASFGRYALAFAIASYLCLLVDWGFLLGSPGAIARAAGDRARITELFWSTLAAKAVLAGAALLGLAAAMAVSPTMRATAPVILAAAGMVPANLLNQAWCLHGLERMGRLAIAAMVGRGLTIPAVLLLVRDAHDDWRAAAIQSAGAGVAGLISIAMLRGLRIIGRPGVSIAAVRQRLGETWPLFVSAVSANLYTSSNIVALGWIAGPGATGLFGAADRVRGAAQALTTPIGQALYPRTQALMARDPVAALALARRMLAIQAPLTLAIGGALFVGADPIVALAAGPGYGAAADVLRCLSPIPFLVGVAGVLGMQVMLPLGLERRFGRIAASAAIVDLALVVPLTRLGGPAGTALAASIAEATAVAAMMVSVHRAGIGWRRDPLGDPCPT